MYAFFQRHPELTPELYVPPLKYKWQPLQYGFISLNPEPLSGYHLTLNAFTKLALTNQITQYKEHEIDISDPFKFSFLELEAEAISIAKGSLDQIAKVLPDQIASVPPSLQVDVEEGVIRVMGIPVAVDRLQAQFVAKIIDFKGGWVSGTEIKKYLGLPEDYRIDRNIYKKLPQDVREQIESSKGKGYRWRCS